MARVDIHADMLTLQAAYPWQYPEFVAAEDAEIVAFHDEAREAWLDDWLTDLKEEPAEEDELVVEWVAAATSIREELVDYVPFQQEPAFYTDCAGTLHDEPGYYESLYPFNH